FRTICYDWRGVGRSSKPRDGYTTQALVDDLISLTESVGAGPTASVAHGAGAHVALRAYYDRPDLFSFLVLCSGAPWRGGDIQGIGAGVPDEFTQLAASELGPNGGICVQGYAELYSRYYFYNDPGPAVAQWFTNMALETPLYVLRAYSESR